MEAVKTSKWYVIKVTANKERKMKEYIEKQLRFQNLSQYVPQILVPSEKKLTLVSGKKQVREYITMPGYLFIEADFSHGEVQPALKNIQGVFGDPTFIRESELAKFIGIKEETPVWDNFEVGGRVKILEGPFNTFEGIISSIDSDKSKMDVIVSIFARETKVEVLFSQVEKIADKK